MTKRPSEAQHGGSLKSPVEAEATGEDVASHIFGTAKAVLEQSRQEFMQLLQSLAALRLKQSNIRVMLPLRC